LWVSIGTRPGAWHRDLPAERIETMGYVTTKDGVEIFYKDWGPKNAQPLVFHHGWPLSADDWDTQMLYFVDGLSGHRP
jgi:non-heme chloroperoxidase